jgi:5-methylcytosine-specific restriction protein B
MTPTKLARKHVIENYVRPARLRGESTVQVRVGNVVKELGWTNRTPSVFSTLSSQAFQREAGLELIEKRGGPASGGPSTTVQFVFRILAEATPPQTSPSPQKPVQDGSGLEKLYGIFKDVYAAFGGGEAYLKAEREWGPDVWERYEAEERARKENRG